jgi:hypothetical protein
VLINKNFHVFISSFVLVAFELIAISVYAGDADDKPYNDEYEYSPTNGSHMQLAYGRNRKPQSEL